MIARVAAQMLGLVILGLLAGAGAEEVVALTTATFDRHLADNKQTLVEFYAPWCGHCKKLAPEYEKAAGLLKAQGAQVSLAKVDATEEKDLGSKYGVKGFPTLVWFEDSQKTEYDGGRTADAIVDWATSMTGPAVVEAESAPEPLGDRPQLVLHADSLLQGFAESAKTNRRKAAWHFVKGAGAHKVVLRHKGEDPVELTEGCGDKASLEAFLADNALPLFGKLDGDTFDKYMEAGKGIVWSLFPPAEDGADSIEVKYRPMMSEIARKFKSKYFVTWTDTEKFREAIENMLSVTEYPAIAVQKKAGDKKKYVWDGEMTASEIARFIEDVEAGRAQPRLKSEPEPASNDDAVRVVVGHTMQRELFTPDKDVLLEVYAPWCGHCKKLEPEYVKLAKKIKKEELTDLLTIAKMDGTANDSPVDSMDWTGFPTIFYIKAGNPEPTLYDGERTAKGLWKYIKKHATKASEIRERLERRKGQRTRTEEL